MKDFTLELTDAEKQEIYVWVDQFKLSGITRQAEAKHRQRFRRCPARGRDPEDLLPAAGRTAQLHRDHEYEGENEQLEHP